MQDLDPVHSKQAGFFACWCSFPSIPPSQYKRSRTGSGLVWVSSPTSQLEAFITPLRPSRAIGINMARSAALPCLWSTSAALSLFSFFFPLWPRWIGLSNPPARWRWPSSLAAAKKSSRAGSSSRIRCAPFLFPLCFQKNKRFRFFFSFGLSWIHQSLDFCCFIISC